MISGNILLTNEDDAWTEETGGGGDAGDDAGLETPEITEEVDDNDEDLEDEFE